MMLILNVCLASNTGVNSCNIFPSSSTLSSITRGTLGGADLFGPMKASVASMLFRLSSSSYISSDSRRLSRLEIVGQPLREKRCARKTSWLSAPATVNRLESSTTKSFEIWKKLEKNAFCMNNHCT